MDKILKALIKLRDKAADGLMDDSVVGICHELNKLGVDRSSRIISDNSEGWLYHSGEWSYPIPGGETLFSASNHMWEGEELEYRLSLLDHLITKAEAGTLLLECPPKDTGGV